MAAVSLPPLEFDSDPVSPHPRSMKLLFDENLRSKLTRLVSTSAIPAASLPGERPGGTKKYGPINRTPRLSSPTSCRHPSGCIACSFEATRAGSIMALNIRNPDTERLAAELARLTGKTKTPKP